MKISSLSLIALLLFSCNGNKKNQPLAAIEIQAINGPELRNLSEIAEEIEYIPFETKPDALMSSVGGLLATEEKYYLNIDRKLFCFDKKGKFLYKLDNLGRGPEQYTYLSDFDVQPDNRLVMALTNGGIQFYSETDTGFRYLRKIDMNVQPQNCDFIPGEENILLSFNSSTGEKDFQHIIINPEGDTLFKKPNYYKFTRVSRVAMVFRDDNIINKTGDGLSIKGLFSDTLFTLNRDYELRPNMIINTGGAGITTDFLANIPMSDPNISDPLQKIIRFTGILEVDRYLFFDYYFEKSSHLKVYDKESGLTSAIDINNPLKDDISGGIDIVPKFSSGGLLYSSVDALTFKNHMAEKASTSSEVKNSKREAELVNLAKSIKEDDNPILIVITPKK